MREVNRGDSPRPRKHFTTNSCSLGINSVELSMRKMMFRQLPRGKVHTFTVLKSNKLIVVAYWHVSTLHHTGIDCAA